MTITVLAHLTFRDDALDEGLKALQEILPDTRAFEGCFGVDVTRDQQEPRRIVLIERWRSAADHKAYLAWRAETGSSGGMRAALAENPAVTYLEHLDAL